MNLSLQTMNTNAMLLKLNAVLPQLVSLSLVVALAYTLADLTWQILPDEESSSTTAVAAHVASPQKKQGVRDITGAYLYGKSQGRAPVRTQSQAPVTKLNLKLKGVLAAGTSSLATAIISSGNAKEDIYGIGDKIQRGVKVHEIHSDHVVIDRQGQLEKLVLEKSLGGSVAARKPAQRVRSKPAGSLRAIRDEILQDVTSIGDYAVPIVVKENGKQIGYRLKPQKKGAALQKAGIVPGDVITEINGVKMDTAQNGIKALRELKTARSVNLTVKRGNSFVPLNIQLQ